MEIVPFLVPIALIVYCVMREMMFSRKEIFYMEKIDKLTDKLMSRDFESYMYATKKDWNEKREKVQENPLMEDMGTIESYIG